ncbi:S8 family serine peptidase [Actinophytocola gossypii]|uniref:S8 family serine peptidase n=1 Tax=Actinophytocola gossypii TaxID=2812003 RepID=A0ABT2J7W9_9PSEU|nr:S8 family serine peptidase [Actinophytocola gossypii]MCT2583948.1 S8 family serine peptidase [Actinophytocola gossypii]
MVLGTVLATAPAAAAAPSTAASPETTANTTANSTVQTVTLITGDQVVMHDGQARSVRPGPGRDGMSFSAFTHDDHTYVIPADARRLVATGRVDRRLFDVTTLIEFGYDDAHRDSVPLIVTHPEDRAAPRVAGATDTRALDSIDAVAMTAEKGGTTWEALTDGTATRRTAGGVSKVWLDGKRTSTLDHSVPQIGAPTAWEAGYTGEGITVAVLDTGVDQTHPDLADREIAEQNFTEAPDNVDNFGHGTHVASIVAGTGAKSEGKYRGVAWGASILDGKVLDDFGGGLESWIIAGMEWAAEQGADVANLSLGGGDTADIDPLEEAVNRLSAETDTLFVIAAGNSGPGAGTVGSPGSAEAALTVGAVDRDDELADFSSRGPRIGDGGIKPDVTAPGVDIVAALHAAGTIGPPVVDGYTALSGTSMAAPHVAGAAALLAQQHPDWTGEQLKAVLTGSATPHESLTAFEQGSGRVDVAAAMTQTLVTEPTNVSLGTVAWPHDDDEPVTKELTYRNLGDTDVTLALSVEATGPDGAPADLFSLSDDEVTVPAGGEASVSVTGDTTLGSVDGAYSGAVLATSGESVTRTPVAITREVESYDVTLNFLDDNGQPTGEYSTLLIGLDNDTFAFPYDEDGSVEVRLPKGRYVADHMVFTAGGDHYNLLPQPGLVVDQERTVTVDAREAGPVEVTPPGDVTLGLGDLGYEAATDTSSFGSAFLTNDLSTLSIGQIGSASPDVRFTAKINTQWLGANGDFYGLSWFPEGGMPTGFTRHVEQGDLATVRAEFAQAVEGTTASRPMFPQPPSGAGFVFGLGSELALPGSRTEYLSTEGGVRWASTMWISDAEGDSISSLDSPPTAYRAGRTYQDRFNHAVFGPALPETEYPWVYRVGDDLAVSVPLFSDGAGHAGFSVVESGSTKLYRGDELIGELPAGGGYLTGLPPEPGEYRLVSTAHRPAIFDLTTAVTAEWTFTSEHAEGSEPTAVDLNTVRFTPRLDENNAAPAGRSYLVPLTVQDESGERARPRSLRVDVSYDGGASWQRVPVLLKLVAVLHHPADAETVSLRATATDREGNTLKQTIVDAYDLR